MANAKLKEENYTNFGGINVKASPYTTGPQQFLDIKNFDFQTPGSLSQRWGSSFLSGTLLGTPVNSLIEFADTDSDPQIFAGGASTWIRYSQAAAENVSFGLGVSFRPDLITAYLFFNAGPLLNLSNFAWKDSKYYGTAKQKLPDQAIGQNRNDYLAYSNNLFAADRSKFAKIIERRGPKSFVCLRAGLPYVSSSPTDVQPVVTPGLTLGVGMGLTGTYFWAASYVNSDDFEGPITPIGVYPAGSFNNGSLVVGGSLSQILGVNVSVLLPAQIDITKINVYSYWSSIVPSGGVGPGWIANNSSFANLYDLPYTFLRTYNVTTSFGITTQGASFYILGGDTYLSFNLGHTLANFSLVINNANPLYIPNNYDLLGGATMVPASDTVFNSFVEQAAPNPGLLELYQNRQVMAGFSGTEFSNKFAISDIGLPEAFDQDLVFEVVTNDGDSISALKAYNQRLYIFKRQSMHEFTGDDLNNFSLREMSLEYGALNNACVQVYAKQGGDHMMFLDSRGLMQFNGAALSPLSNVIDPIFQTMNITAAVRSAVMVHDKARSQVMCSIPVNGATINNLTVVYDYLLNAFSTYDGVVPSSYAVSRLRFNTPTVIYGGFSGGVSYYGPSFATDNGVGFTCMAKTRYISELGNTTEKQFRRLWLNMSEAQNSTVSVSVNMRQDYGASIVYSTTMLLSQFQNRIDYGIPAKSLSYEFSTYSTTQVIQLYGYGVAYRYQRNV